MVRDTPWITQPNVTDEEDHVRHMSELDQSGTVGWQDLGPTLIEGVNIIVGDGSTIHRGHVLMADGVIQDVGSGPTGPQATFRGRHLDRTDWWLTPGLIDAHCHLCYELGGYRDVDDPAIADIASANARATLAAGITSVRDLGGMRQQNLLLKRDILAGRVAGPRMVSAGDIICRPGGHMHHYARQACGTAEVRAAAREQIDAGAEVVKLMASGGIAVSDEDPSEPEFSQAEMQAAVDVAHERRAKVAAHAHPSEAIRAAAQAGCDSIEHGTDLSEEIVNVLLERKTAVIPTLSVYDRMARGADGVDARLSSMASELWARKIPALQRAMLAGVAIGVGTDAGTNFPAGDIVTELELLHAIGMGTDRVLAAATSVNAEVLGLTSTVGTVEKGKAADLLLLEDSPLVNLSVLRRPSAVISGGRWLTNPDSLEPNMGGVK